MDIKDDTKVTFLQFYKEYYDFMIGPEYYQPKRLCVQVGSICQTMLVSPLRKWFVHDKEKFANSQSIFHDMQGEGSLIVRFVYEILTKLEQAIDSIRRNYERAKQIQEEFLENVKEHKQRIRELNNGLNDLLRDYVGLSGAILSI